MYCLQFWEVVGVWFSGLMTLAAVFFSLYIARRSEQVRLKVSASFSRVYGDAGNVVEADCIGLYAINVGLRPARVDAFLWGLMGCEPGTWIYKRVGASDRLPKKVEYEEEVREIVSWHELAPEIVKQYLHRFPSLAIRFLRVYASTRTGEMIKGSLTKELRRQLVKLAKDQNRLIV